ncbi:hypothetical protein BS50DRAFT_582073 [Corynespora cassiicola Philippines]|uniref:Uncharacterized protein n=1 Tax=Corynespora cassiicola Philippines TaxID=1448308 RepID=A0A2T2PCL6_CORCC|nr:hypothetical protein BS50DRAFT_582073 [Corynespora cassiicola Philippines]
MEEQEPNLVGHGHVSFRTEVDPSQIKGGYCSNHTLAPIPYRQLFNYDIRMLIYQKMCLPPIYKGYLWTGMALSCKDAYAEFSESSARELNKHLLRFKRDINSKLQSSNIKLEIPPVPLHSGLEYVKCIRVKLPIETLLAERIGDLRNIFNLNLEGIILILQGTGEDILRAKKLDWFYKSKNIDWFHNFICCESAWSCAVDAIVHGLKNDRSFQYIAAPHWRMPNTRATNKTWSGPKTIFVNWGITRTNSMPSN